MAKKTTRTSAERAAIRIQYDLHDLSSTQHKAGLAGLLLQVESMMARGMPSIPQVRLTGPTTVDVVFTETSVRALLDDLYDARIVEARSAAKWRDKTPKRVEAAGEAGRDAVSTGPVPDVDAPADEAPTPTTSGRKSKPKRWFIYDVVQPQGHFLRQFTDDGKEVWHKLWRDMLWAVPRGKPTTRGPFNERAAGKSSGEGEALWRELVLMEEAGRSGQFRTCEVAGAVWLGAQAVSAEAVPFRDRIEHALLLHFWQVTVRVFVPEQVNADGSREFLGFVLAIPEVSDLRRFIRLYKRALAQLDAKPSGYRPHDAVISLPEHGALEFMENLARLIGQTASAEVDDVSLALSGVEFFHVVKAGNNIKTMSHGRLSAQAGLLRRYQTIRQTCWNPLFLSERLLALLRDQRWYVGFGAMFAGRPWRLFVQDQRTPRSLPSFARDSRERFETTLAAERLRMDESNRKAGDMTQAEAGPQQRLEALVYRLVRHYVRIKTEMKSGIKFESFRDRKVTDGKGRDRVDYPRLYVEAQERVCSDLFLGFRSRSNDDFVSYFTGAVGSVPQGRNLSAEEDFRIVTEALLDPERWREVKTLAMLAASASSYTPRESQNQNPMDDKETDQ